MERHKYGFKSIQARHPLKFTAPIDAAVKAQPEESTGLALRGLVACLMEDTDNSKPCSASGVANLVDFTIRRQRRLVRSTFSAELNGLVDSIEQMMLLHVALHQFYCGTGQKPEEMVD